MADIESTGGTLSYLNIQDRLLRSELFREIRRGQETQGATWGKDGGTYVIQPADVLSPELVAYKCYGLDTLKWVIMVAAYLDDPRDRLESGTTLYLPKAAWLRQRVRYYANMGVKE